MQVVALKARDHMQDVVPHDSLHLHVFRPSLRSRGQKLVFHMPHLDLHMHSRPDHVGSWNVYQTSCNFTALWCSLP